MDELKGLVASKSLDECKSILPYWSKSYTKLSIVSIEHNSRSNHCKQQLNIQQQQQQNNQKDNDRKIRETCQQLHERLCSKVSKSLAPHLKTIMPYWILAMSDTYNAARQVAETAFRTTFNEAKQPDVINFAKEEILSVRHTYTYITSLPKMTFSNSNNNETTTKTNRFFMNFSSFRR